MTKNRTRTPVYMDPGMHPGLEVKGLIRPTEPGAILNLVCNPPFLTSAVLVSAALAGGVASVNNSAFA